MKIHAALMLKAPRPGTVKTRLAASLGAEHAATIYRQLAEHQIRQIPPGWQCSVHYAPQDAGEEMLDWLAGVVPDGTAFYPQCDGDLGARMRHAVRTELAGGADAVALIGGDCPGLLRPVLDDVAAASRNHDLVIVPATDGGYVLLFVKADHPELFREIAWSTAQVMQQTKAAADRAGRSVSLLPELTDVDDINDLEMLGKLFPRASWDF